MANQRKQLFSSQRHPAYRAVLTYRFHQFCDLVRNSRLFTAALSTHHVVLEIVGALARLPLLIKCFIGLAILVEFLVVTQWERLTFSQSPPPARPAASIEVQPTDNNIAPAATDKAQNAAADEALAKRWARFEIIDPQVQVNGSITANSQILYLYVIKRFDSKNLCTKASGERWACGLHAYATLRNTIAEKTVVCDPKALMPNAVTAICRIGPTNIALALVRAGLVELDDNAADADLISAQSLAKSGKLGIWDR